VAIDTPCVQVAHNSEGFGLRCTAQHACPRPDRVLVGFLGLSTRKSLEANRRCSNLQFPHAVPLEEIQDGNEDARAGIGRRPYLVPSAIVVTLASVFDSPRSTVSAAVGTIRWRRGRRQCAGGSFIFKDVLALEERPSRNLSSAKYKTQHKFMFNIVAP